MNIVAVAGFATITKDPAASRALYRDALGLPLKASDDYSSMDGYDGAKHFGVWPLWAAAPSCFGTDTWPAHVPAPNGTLELELADPAAVAAAVDELKAVGYTFIHDARVEPWGQTVARLMSPEGVLRGLSYAPWPHGESPPA